MQTCIPAFSWRSGHNSRCSGGTSAVSTSALIPLSREQPLEATGHIARARVNRVNRVNLYLSAAGKFTPNLLEQPLPWHIGPPLRDRGKTR